jgi:predicted nucleic acid-binding protein
VRWLLDTNVVSENIRERPRLDVLRWLNQQPRVDIAISLVTVAEIQHGILLSNDEARRVELAHWLDDEVLPSFEDRVLPITLDVTIRWLELLRVLSAGRVTRAPPDLLLAATAQTHDLTLVTRKTRDFANTGITVYNPWTDETQQMEAP